MKIIENNYVPEYPKKIICPKCASILEVEKSDIKSSYDPRDGYEWYECPCCKQESLYKK